MGTYNDLKKGQSLKFHTALLKKEYPQLSKKELKEWLKFMGIIKEKK
jgi:hypothetical protein